MVNSLLPEALALVIVPAAVSSFIVAIRLWKRVFDRDFAIEDILLFLAQVLILVFTSTTCVAYQKSWYGYHYYEIPEGVVDHTEVQKWSFINSVIYNPILGLIKASFLITLIKLRSPNPLIHYSLWVIFTVNALSTIVASLVCILQCRPIARFWDRSILGICLDAANYTYGTMGIVLVTDVMVLIMPIWIIYNLLMPLKRKLMAAAFLSFGFAVTGIGAYRFYMYSERFEQTNNLDMNYDVRQGLSNVEVSLASIGACGGTVKWVLGLFIPFFAGQTMKPPVPKHRSCCAAWLFCTSVVNGTDTGYVDCEKGSPHGIISDAPTWNNQTCRPLSKPRFKSGEYRIERKGRVLKKNTRYRDQIVPDVDREDQVKGFHIVKTTEWDVASGRNVTATKSGSRFSMPEIGTLVLT